MTTVSRSNVFTLAASIDYANGAVVSKAIIRKEAGTVTLFAFATDERLSEHTAPFDALVELLDGEAEISINGQPYRLSTGHAIIMPASIPHEVRAVERFKMVLTTIKEIRG